MKKGYYFVIAKCKFYEDVIVSCEPYVLLAYYFGGGEWDTELLSGEEYKVKEVIFPDLKDFN